MQKNKHSMVLKQLKLETSKAHTFFEILMPCL
jgi:hypothetical protein